MKEAIPRRVLPVILANPRWSRRASRNRHISGIASLTSRTGVVTIVEGERAAYERRNDDCARGCRLHMGKQLRLVFAPAPACEQAMIFVFDHPVVLAGHLFECLPSRFGSLLSHTRGPRPCGCIQRVGDTGATDTQRLSQQLLSPEELINAR